MWSSTLIDDMGLKQLPKHSGEYLLEVIMRRYENRSTIMTSNRPLEEWGKLLCDVPTAGAIIDRFLHHAQVVAITGKSYRVKEAAGGHPGKQEKRTSPTNLRPPGPRAKARSTAPARFTLLPRDYGNARFSPRIGPCHRMALPTSFAEADESGMPSLSEFLRREVPLDRSRPYGTNPTTRN